MNCLLAIELSTPRGHIAVLRDDGTLLLEREFTSHRSHNSMLYAPLAEALAVAGDTLRSIVVGTGPGSYTGVRIAIAAAQGVAISRNVSMCGLPSVTALSDAPEHIVIGDARRGLFHGTRIRNGRVVESMVVVDDATMRAWLTERASLPCFTSDAAPPSVHPEAQRVSPSAVLLAQHALTQKPASQDLIEPLYVQEAFISKARAK